MSSNGVHRRGAARANVLRLIGTECGKLLLVGLLLGTVLATAAFQAIAKMLYSLSVLLLALVALPASLVPAIRASRLDPMKTRREE